MTKFTRKMWVKKAYQHGWPYVTIKHDYAEISPPAYAVVFRFVLCRIIAPSDETQWPAVP